MQIVSCRVHPVRVTYDETVSGTHLVVRLETDEGIEGVSFVSRLGGASVQPLALLITNAVHLVRGADPLDAEALYARLYRSGVGAM